MKKNILLSMFFLLVQIVVGQHSDQKLLGECSVADLKKEPFAAWYTSGYNGYFPNAEALSQVKKLHSEKYSIKIFFGTWCGDSRRELPRMSKILNELLIPEKNIQWIALDDSSAFYKQSPQHEERGMNIYRVPTFIFYKKGNEIGRIVEFPKESLERDLLKILSRQLYEPNYQSYPYHRVVAKWNPERSKHQCSRFSRTTSRQNFSRERTQRLRLCFAGTR